MSASLRSRLRRWLHMSRISSQPVRNTSLHLETLEGRALPSATIGHAQPPLDQTFIATIYQGELQRPADNAGLIFWRNVLSQTGSRTQVVNGILNSNEYLNGEVWSDYSSILGRAPDPSGWSNFMQALQHGATPQNVRADILGSDEFFSRVGDNGGSFLNALYSDALGRPVDGQGLAHWAPLTGSAAGRALIAREVEASPEASNLFVTSVYQDILGRNPDGGGLAFWSSQLQQGGSQTTVLAGVLGSDEFFRRMQVYVGGLNTNDPNVAAARFIAADHVFGPPPAPVPVPQPVGVMTSGDGSGDTSNPMDMPPVGVIPNPIDNPVVDTPVIDIPVIDTPVVDNPVVDNPSDNTPVFDNSCDCPVVDTPPADTAPPVDNSPPIDNSSPVDNSQPVDTSSSSLDNTYTAYSVDPSTQDTSGYTTDTSSVDTSSFDTTWVS